MKIKKKIHPYFIIMMTFLVVIILGTLFLMLPISSKDGKSIGFVDSLFMATSATCVTGLATVPVSGMTLFGKIIMAILMEIGGLSIITIAVFFFTILGARLSASNKFLLREALNQNSVNGITGLVKKIIIISFIIQLIGIIINIFPLLQYTEGNFINALGFSTFHSIASFNNAGFDAFGSNSMIDVNEKLSYANYLIFNTSTMFLIIFGGIGFVVLDDIVKNKRFKKFSLHSKIVLITTLILVFIGALLIKLTAWTDITWIESFFTSITSRTAGFTVKDLSILLEKHPATYTLIILLMVIGASPCSTGGGIKTTTIAVAALAIYYYARGKKTKLFNRRIGDSQIFKAFVLIAIAIFVVIVGTFVISALQPELGLTKILFEVASAFSTTGLSMGITASLNIGSKLVICLLMLFGRLGPLTVIGVVNKNWMTESKESINYIEESVIIG